MKAWQLNNRVKKLSETLADPVTSMVKLDYDSFSEAEKTLFAKVDEVVEKYRETGSEEALAENCELIFKKMEVILMRVREIYCYTVPKVLGSDENHDIAEYFFQLHFRSFEADLSECLANVRKWSDEEKAAFALDLKKNGPFFYRIPRVNEHLTDKDC